MAAAQFRQVPQCLQACSQARPVIFLFARKILVEGIWRHARLGAQKMDGKLFGSAVLGGFEGMDKTAPEGMSRVLWIIAKSIA